MNNMIRQNAQQWNSLYFKCVKQSVEAMLVLSNGVKIYGSNAQECEKTICPRTELGITSYEPCDNICKQVNHAERDCIKKAVSLGYDTKDSVMYLTGHWVCCDECRLVMALNGVKEALLINDNGLIINEVIFDGSKLGVMTYNYAEALTRYNNVSV